MPSLRKRPAPPEEPPKRATTATLSSKKEAKVVEREEPSLLHRLRNMWQFANLFQFIVLFNKALKLDENMDIEDLEFECQKPSSPMLLDIGVALLKVVSSRHGINHETFDEEARRQYEKHLPLRNPFGSEENPVSFGDFDVFTKIRVLQQLTQWALIHPERIREKVDEHNSIEQSTWRIEPYGWDSKDRSYFVLDDNRVYRLTEAPPPPLQPAPPKKNSKKARAAARAKRRRISSTPETDGDVGEEKDENAASEPKPAPEPEDDGLGGMKWECIAVTLDEVQQFIGTMQKSRDPNEKILRDRLVEHLVPILEKQEEARRKKAAQRERELLILAKLATAKRSSRIASRAEAQRQEEEARAEAERRRAEAEAARKEKSLRMKLEREREARLLAREKRAKEREAKRAEQQEALARLAEEEMHDEEGGRTSSRLLKAEIDKRRRLLEELDEEEEEWIFDCVCGVYGKVDDGTHSISCERCNVWLHSKCVGISEEQAERDEFHFVCPTCLRREEAAKMEAAREEARLAAEREAAQREAEEAVNRTETTTMETEAGRIEAEEKAKAKRAQLAAAAAARRKKNAEKRAAEEAAARAAAIAAGEKPKFRVKFIKPHSLSGPGDAGNSAGSVPLASLPIQKISIPAPATAAPTIPAATAQPTPVVGTPQNLGPVAGPTAPASSSAPTKVTIYPAVHPVSLSNPAVPGAPPAANGSSRPQAKLPPVDEEKANGIFNKKAPDLKPAQVAIGGPQVQLPVKHSAPPTHPLPATWNSSPGLTGLHSPSNPPHDPGTGLSPESSPYSRSNPFSSAHPTIAPPEQSPRKARAYESIQDLSSSPPRIPNGYVYTQETPQISQDVMSHAQQGVDPPVLEADGQPAVASTMDDNGATSGPLYLANGQTPPATAGVAGDDPTRTYNLLSGSAQGPPQELQQDFGSPVKQ